MPTSVRLANSMLSRPVTRRYPGRPRFPRLVVCYTGAPPVHSGRRPAPVSPRPLGEGGRGEGDDSCLRFAVAAQRRASGAAPRPRNVNKPLPQGERGERRPDLPLTPARQRDISPTFPIQGGVRRPDSFRRAGAMNRRRLVKAGWLLAAAWAALSSGCVVRQYTILTDPPGAIVLENGRYVGPSPAVRPFLYYGTYRFTLIRDGFQTLEVEQPIRAPWYEYFPLEFIAENLIPWTIYDKREFHYALEPTQVPPPEVVLDRASNMRAQGQSTGVPLAHPPAPVPPPGAVPGPGPVQILPPVPSGQVPPGAVQPPAQPQPQPAPLAPVPQFAPTR